MRDRIIVALDVDAHDALRLAHELRGTVEWLKVGMTLFYAEGPAIVDTLRDMGFKVFVDLKLHDIPHQVEGAARSLASGGASLMTVHACGGGPMMEAALLGAHAGAEKAGLPVPAIIAVSVLTSMDAQTLADVGVDREVEAQVLLLAKLAADAGLQGMVCSPLEAHTLRGALGPKALIVTPGVRPVGAESGDQSRIATPRQAIEWGASHVVIGRPVTGAEDPRGVIADIIGREGA